MSGIAACFGEGAETVVERILNGFTCRTRGPRTISKGPGFAIGGDGVGPVASGAVVAVIDGIVHNYAQLAAEMRAEGHKLVTKEAAEAACALYAEFGPDGERLLDGELAMILAGPGGEPFLSRDRYSGTPLFYGVTAAGGLAAGSERAAVEAVAADVKELPPATYYASGIGELTYFEPARGSAYITDEAAGLALSGYHMLEAVERRIGGAKRVAVISDGGVASKLVAAYAQQLGAQVEVIAPRGGAQSLLDLSTAFEVAVVEVEIDRNVEGAPGPCARLTPDPVTVTRLAALAQAASERGHSVVLTAAGSDELFGAVSITPLEKPEDTHELLRRRAAARSNGIFASVAAAGAGSGVQIRAVFADPNVAMAAWELSPALKYHEGRPGWPLERLLARALAATKVPTG